jgi:hypothetical protein
MKHVLRILIDVLSCISTALSLALLLLAASLLSTTVALALHVSPIALAVTQLIPAPLCFWGVVASPFGGVFRTDFAILAIAFFVVAKLLHLLRKAL